MLLLVPFFLLQYCFLGIVHAGPIKELLSPNAEPSESSRSPRYSPYKVKPINNQIGSFECSNGHVFTQSILLNSVARLCPRIAHLRQLNVAITLVPSDPGFQTYDYPIHPSGRLLEPAKDVESEYSIRIHQDLKDLSKCSFAAVYSTSGPFTRRCTFIFPSKVLNQPWLHPQPQLHSRPNLQSQFRPLPQFRPQSISLSLPEAVSKRLSQKNPQSLSPSLKLPQKRYLDCNGKHFDPNFIYLTLNYAKTILHAKMTKLQLSSNEIQGYPKPFSQSSLPIKDTWMFPLVADGKSFYSDGHPGLYFIVIKNDGELVGAYYRKDSRQMLREAAAAPPSMTPKKVDEFGPCTPNDYSLAKNS